MSDTSLLFTILARDQASPVFNKLHGVAAAAGVAIGAALAAGVTGALQKTRTDALLAAQLGAGSEMAGVLGEASGQLYSRGVVDSIETGNQAIQAAITTGLTPPNASAEAIDAVASKIANLGVIMQEDASRVSAAVSQMLRTGVARSAEEAFDLLTAATQRGLNKSGDLLDTVEEYGTQFRVLGLEGPAALGLISQALQAGARDADVAADALKEFAIRAQDGSDTTAEGFAAIGLNADQMASMVASGGQTAAQALDLTLDRLRAMPDPVERSQAAVALFGTKAEDLGAALYAMDVSTAASQLGEFGGAAQRAGDTLEQSAGAKVEAFRRKVEMGLVEVLAVAVGWIERNADALETLAVVLGPPALLIGGIVAATRTWTAVQAALNVVMSANPIGLVVLAIGALIAILVLAWNNSETFRNVVTGVWNATLGGAEALGRGVVAAFQWMMDGAADLWNWLYTGWNNLLAFFGGIPGWISATASGMWNGIWESFRAAINMIIAGWNSIEFHVPAVDVPYVGRFGGFTVGLPDIPFLAAGGNIVGDGLAVVGEAGPELVSLPRGAQVTPLDRGGRGGDTYVFHVHGALDPIGVAREIEKVLRKYSRETGRVELAF